MSTRLSEPVAIKLIEVMTTIRWQEVHTTEIFRQDEPTKEQKEVLRRVKDFTIILRHLFETSLRIVNLSRWNWRNKLEGKLVP